MKTSQFWSYLAVMAGSTYLIRAIPFAAAKEKIKSPFIRSFLYYIPYTVLTAMTIPAAFYATGSIVSAAVGLGVAVLLAIKEKNLTMVALTSCLAVFLTEFIQKVM